MGRGATASSRGWTSAVDVDLSVLPGTWWRRIPSDILNPLDQNYR